MGGLVSKAAKKKAVQNVAMPYSATKGRPTLLHAPANPDDKTNAVIITISSGSSYDPLFTTVKQESEPGTFVPVFQLDVGDFPHLVYALLEGHGEEYDQILKHVRQVDPDCVLINFECSAGFSDTQLGEGVIRGIRDCLDLKYFLMFSDFAVKGLIGTWKEDVLGPKALLKVGEFGGHFKLQFDPEKLVACDSVQLQNVGKLCKEGSCNVEALGGTVAFTVNKEVQQKENPVHNCEVLTIMSMASSLNIPQVAGKNLHSIGEKKGLPGHVLLNYKSGGRMLLSCGHWIELDKPKVKEEDFMKAYAENYGAEKMMQKQMEFCSLSGEERQQKLAYEATNFIQASAPCNMQSKKKK